MLHNKYKKYIRTITSTYKGEVENNVVLAKIRNYDSAISASLYSDNVPVDIYDNLIKKGAKYASIAILRWVLGENVKNSISKTLDDIDIDLLYRN